MAQAWQKREKEQADFLQDLHSRVCHDPEGEYLFDVAILNIARLMLRTVIEEINNCNRLANPEIRWIVEDVNRFARTRAEAIILKHRLIGLLLISGFHGVDSEYLRQRVHEPERLYDGHQATDEVEL